MRKLITAALFAAVAMPATAIPGAASAQSNRELRRDRQDIREEQRDLRQAYRSATAATFANSGATFEKLFASIAKIGATGIVPGDATIGAAIATATGRCSRADPGTHRSATRASAPAFGLELPITQPVTWSPTLGVIVCRAPAVIKLGAAL
jgi:hypothetical protein